MPTPETARKNPIFKTMNYIQLYHGNAELLAESLEIVQRTASAILTAIQPPASAAGPETEPVEAEVA